MKKLTTEEFVKRAKEKHQEYDYSETVYINKRTKIQYKCPKHGIQWQLPYNHMKYGCNDCGYERAAEKKRKPWETQLQQFHETHGDDYDYSKSKYVNIDTLIEIKCNKCGKYFWQSPYEHQTGANCPFCFGRYKTTEEVIAAAREVHGDVYDYSNTVYVNAVTPFEIYCPIHKKSFWQTYGNHVLLGNRCPECAASKYKGEERIKKFLIGNNIDFIPQHHFDDLRDKTVLRFDFYIPSYNLLIEYDGPQHKRPVDFGGGLEEAEKNFEETVKHDKMKTEYCSRKNIPLLRIPEEDFNNIETILCEKICVKN